MSALDALALRVGIEERFLDAKGEIRVTTAETKKLLLAAMGFRVSDETEAAAELASIDRTDSQRSLPPVHVVAVGTTPLTIEALVPVGWQIELEDGTEMSGSAQSDIPYGYHRLRSDVDGAVSSLIVTPGRCWLPPAAEEGRQLWGVAAQLYLLRSDTNWGMGDFSDLCRLSELVQERGGDVVGLNPLHALFLDNPEQASPYSPENRLLLNVLNIDVEGVPELADSPETQLLMASEAFQSRLEICRAASMVDYAAVANIKLQALRLLFECCKNSPDSTRWQAFRAFREERGPSFQQSCLFEAIRQHFAAISGTLADWHSWPADYRDPSSTVVARFAEEHAGAVNLYAWMQWVADQQLEAAAEATRGMEVGLYRDLAVGADPSGAAAWSNPAAVVSGAHVGAPPDIYNPAGQDWGLPPFHPRALRESGYQAFIELVRANMRHAGGLRIDHVMALQHLYWVPKGNSPSQGAYVQYPLDDLVGILALESHRNRCLVVGEDLGTVPEGFRERMAEANILSYRVLFFEQDAKTGAFLPPESYPRLALAVTGSHDLPTVRGWWDATDIAIREQLKLFPSRNGAAEARETRERDRRELVRALRQQKLLPPTGPVQTEELTAAVHAYLARTDALITMIQLDDITAETDPVNVPTTSDEHPNWRRRLSLTLEQLAAHSRMERLARMFENERGS
ncbi:MAG: glycogen debranching enzyme [Bryobacterales bacterium]|jgi:4-alpha-glucanotransferase|nr:glycogen debranching enzyme [Bryobacterales bacterium]